MEMYLIVALFRHIASWSKAPLIAGSHTVYELFIRRNLLATEQCNAVEQVSVMVDEHREEVGRLQEYISGTY